MDNYELQELYLSADSGFVSAQFELYKHLNKRDKEKAFKYLEMAALNGHTDAQLCYAVAIQDKRPEEALKLFKRLSRAKNVEADYLAGVLIESLADCPKGLSNAFKKYMRAAKGGSLPAASRLMAMYEDGVGCGFNAKQARKWADRAGLVSKL